MKIMKKLHMYICTKESNDYSKLMIDVPFRGRGGILGPYYIYQKSCLPAKPLMSSFGYLLKKGIVIKYICIIELKEYIIKIEKTNLINCKKLICKKLIYLISSIHFFIFFPLLLNNQIE